MRRVFCGGFAAVLTPAIPPRSGISVSVRPPERLIYPDMGTTAEANMRGPAGGEHREDGNLVARFRAGESAAFDELVLAHQDRVVRLACRLLGRRQEAEDVVQEVFLSVLVHLKRFRGECRFSTWLTRIVVNKCRSHRRWRLRRWRLLFRGVRDEELPAAGADCGDGPTAQGGEDVSRAVDRLPARYREPVVLRYFEDLSIAEIGETLGLSPNAVEVRLTRAREKLRRMLSAKGLATCPHKRGQATQHPDCEEPST